MLVHNTGAILVHAQVLFGSLVTGSFQRELANRCVFGIINMSSWYIKFPYSVGEQANIKRQFATMSGLLNVSGATDCTHIAIRAPSWNKCICVNGWEKKKKGVHMINVQVIYDLNRILTNSVARWPSSTCDTFVLAQSSIGRDRRCCIWRLIYMQKPQEVLSIDHLWSKGGV